MSLENWTHLEKTWLYLAWLVPPKVVQWALERALSHATTGAYQGTDRKTITAKEVLKRWKADMFPPTDIE